MPKSFTDQEVIAGLRQKTPALTNTIVAYLYTECQSGITWMVLSNQGTTNDANDLFQETILIFLDNVWKGKFELRTNTKVKTYIYGIALLLWKKELNHEVTLNTRAGIFLQQQEYNTTIPTPEAILLDEEDTQHSWKLFKKLGDSCQKILTAYYRDKKTMTEIATEFDLGNEDNAKTRKHRCMKKLKELLAP